MPDNGILLVDKPTGWTSHDVVAKVRNVLKKQAGKKVKVGHTGTLDPLASGLLILVVGSYTKRAQEFSKLDKIYQLTMKLGETSSTGDSEGTITKTVRSDQKRDKKPSKTVVEKTVKGFEGVINQTPPAFSAIKVGGKRAYRLAREGKKVELEPREITIYDISKISYKYPFISFVVRVSSGTYIRSLTEEIGEKLGTGAYLSELRRIEVGEFNVSDATSPADVFLDKISKY